MFAMPNELGTNNALKTMLSKSTGLLSGVADTVVILPKNLILSNLKRILENNQSCTKDFEKRVTNLGYKYFVIRTLSDEFKKLIITLLKKQHEQFSNTIYQDRND